MKALNILSQYLKARGRILHKMIVFTITRDKRREILKDNWNSVRKVIGKVQR